MELIIGRDGATSKLKVVKGTQVKLYGAPSSVPMDVSRQHCQVLIDDANKITIKNIKAANVTYVNGLEVQSKNISAHDKVELGASHYLLPLKEILTDFKEITVDITPLQSIWNNYNTGLNDLTKSQGKLNAISRISGVFSMLAIASGFLLRGQDNPWYFILYGAAILLTIGFTVVSYQNASKIPDKKESMRQQFIHDYVCPHCHHFMGFQDYSIMAQNSNCPYCRVRYSKR